MKHINNPLNLVIGQKCLIRHKSIVSPWIEATVVAFSEEGFPIGKNSHQDFYDSLTNEYEVSVEESVAQKEARSAWMERASRDKRKYDSEDNAFQYYWQLTH